MKDRPLVAADDHIDVVLVKSGEAEQAAELDGMALQWRGAPRRWGHPLHSLCSYFAMFPPQIPRVFIDWLTRLGDVVYDPFSGRGTAALEACRLGRIGLGSDANPLASVLTAAKVDPPTTKAAYTRLGTLSRTTPSRRVAAVPDDIRMLFSARVLRQLTWLRKQLNQDECTDRFILATILGLLHANYTPGSPPRGLSVSMPNTFSMSPGYARRYIAAHGLQPPDVDVLDMIRNKIKRVCLPPATAQRGRGWKADARTPDDLHEGAAKLVFTSPPYMGVIQYGKYNWIRLWMLSCDPREVDRQLLATDSIRRYLEFMAAVLARLRCAVRSDGYVCLMLGDVRNRSTGTTLNLAETLWRSVAQQAGWRRLGVIRDALPEDRKVSRIWGPEKRGHATRTDRVLLLAPPETTHSLPTPPGEIVWSGITQWHECSGAVRCKGFEGSQGQRQLGQSHQQPDRRHGR